MEQGINHHCEMFSGNCEKCCYHQRSADTILNTNNTSDWRQEVIRNILEGNTGFKKKKLPMFKLRIDVPVTCIKRKEGQLESRLNFSCQIKVVLAFPGLLNLSLSK